MHTHTHTHTHTHIVDTVQSSCAAPVQPLTAEQTLYVRVGGCGCVFGGWGVGGVGGGVCVSVCVCVCVCVCERVCVCVFFSYYFFTGRGLIEGMSGLEHDITCSGASDLHSGVYWFLELLCVC